MTETAVASNGAGHVQVMPVSSGSGAADSLMLMKMLERIAADPEVPIERMVQAFELLKQVEDRRSEDERRRAEMSYAAAMAAAQAKLPTVIKNKDNNQTHSKYADLAAIVDACTPIIAGLGFAISASECPSPRNDCMGVRIEVAHCGGCTKVYDFFVPLDGGGFKGTPNKTATHAYGSTFSYGRRYGFCGIFGIATKDDNDGNKQPQNQPTISDKQVAELRDLISTAGSKEEVLRKHFEVDALESLTERQFSQAVYRLNERIKNNANAAKGAKQ